MKKIIAKSVYDTDTAAQIHKTVSGFYGDPAGYEETLYRTPEGRYFVYENGGEASVHPQEKIVRISENKVAAWLEAHE